MSEANPVANTPTREDDEERDARRPIVATRRRLEKDEGKPWCAVFFVF